MHYSIWYLFAWIKKSILFLNYPARSHCAPFDKEDPLYIISISVSHLKVKGHCKFKTNLSLRYFLNNSDLYKKIVYFPSSCSFISIMVDDVISVLVTKAVLLLLLYVWLFLFSSYHPHRLHSQEFSTKSIRLLDILCLIIYFSFGISQLIWQ